MRLLERGKDGAVSLTDDLHDQDIPAYVILSHTWGTVAQEVTLQDIQSQSSERGAEKAGYKKIQFGNDKAAEHGYQYFWIDTCCIDKTNNVELPEAINSMFRWYSEAARCYVYLSDVQVAESQQRPWQDDFRNSKWFTRSWTLQELLAPKSVEFFSSEGILLGDKRSLEKEIHEITGIAVEALRGRSLSDFSVSERMGWAAKRKATRKEDEAYSLFGIFDIYMPLIYGERERAFVRLRKEIDRSIQGPGPASYLSASALGASIMAHHPVKKNYRKVHVTILHWKADELEDVVLRISNVFRLLYHYEVREIQLPHLHKVKLHWPWLDDSFVDERDLQIMYYLGNTIGDPQSEGFMDIAASPAIQPPIGDLYPDDPNSFLGTDTRDPAYFEHYPDLHWLSTMIGIPALTSDVVIVLDCFIEGICRPDENDELGNISFLLDGDYSWARYLVLFAGYTKASTIPGKLSDKLVSLLEELAVSDRFYAREGLITTGILKEKLERKVTSGDDLNLRWCGSEGKDFIHLSPLPTSTAT